MVRKSHFTTHCDYWYASKNIASVMMYHLNHKQQQWWWNNYMYRIYTVYIIYQVLSKHETYLFPAFESLFTFTLIVHCTTVQSRYPRSNILHTRKSCWMFWHKRSNLRCCHRNRRHRIHGWGRTSHLRWLWPCSQRLLSAIHQPRLTSSI